MIVCPHCGNRDSERFKPSYQAKEETLSLICKALYITSKSHPGQLLKQALDILSQNNI